MRAKLMKERDLLVPVAMTGVLMAVYLLIRPYGDTPGPTPHPAEQAAAFASSWWVAAHVAGALALAGFGRLALRLADLTPELFAARLGRWAGLASVVFVLPYFGAETFALHVIGRHAETDPSMLTMVTEIRDQPVAITLFGLGLLLLAVSGIAFAIAWTQYAGSRAAWPLGVLIALVLPQFYLAPVGRMVFGVAYLLAAALFAASVLRRNRLTVGPAPDPTAPDSMTPSYRR